MQIARLICGGSSSFFFFKIDNFTERAELEARSGRGRGRERGGG
jgi:hypothetical protein